MSHGHNLLDTAIQAGMLVLIATALILEGKHIWREWRDKITGRDKVKPPIGEVHWGVGKIPTNPSHGDNQWPL